MPRAGSFGHFTFKKRKLFNTRSIYKKHELFQWNYSLKTGSDKIRKK